jgi:transcription termination factor Rho
MNNTDIDITNLLSCTRAQLEQIATKQSIKHSNNAKQLLCDIIDFHLKENRTLYSTGVIEVCSDKYGFLRVQSYDYNSTWTDIYVPQGLVKKYNILTGDTLVVIVKKSNDKALCLIAHNIISINSQNLATNKRFLRRIFEELTPCYPDKRIYLSNSKNNNNITNRVIDLVAPIGLGQRGLIIAPPKTGKTTMLQSIAKAIVENNKEDVYVIFLMIGERPEEVTETKKILKTSCKKVEVISSTFDDTPAKHTHTAHIVANKAKRMAETGQNVVILLDSLTRLTRSFNEDLPTTGRVLSGV